MGHPSTNLIHRGPTSKPTVQSPRPLVPQTSGDAPEVLCWTTMDWTCSEMSNECSIGLGYGEFGGQVDEEFALCCSLGKSCWVYTIRECWCLEGGTWPATLFGWVVCVKYHPHECQDPTFLQKKIAL